MTRHRRTRDLVTRKGPRVRDKRAEEIKEGDILWSDFSGRLLVLDTWHVEVNASANLLATGDLETSLEFRDEDLIKPNVTAIAILTLRQKDGATQLLGAYAPRTMLKTVRG